MRDTLSLPLLTSQQLGLALRSRRKHLGLTQEELGRRVGLSQNRVSHLERNPGEISFKQLLAWSATLNLELTVSDRKKYEPAPGVEW
ncbi:MAG: helix-turn-helix domain-containing protein [Curvibacter sp.]|nr:helix-turn-helix domain-containing protein [Curvibacter sp.]